MSASHNVNVNYLIMGKNKGWRGYIYDVDWVTFSPNQPGIIISKDGRECETWDDDISRISFIADKNDGWQDRIGGHAMFRQKGTNKTEVVTLNQGSATTYEIRAITTTQMSGCSGDCDTLWSRFLGCIKIIRTINGVDSDITDISKIESIRTGRTTFNIPADKVACCTNVFNNMSGSSKRTAHVNIKDEYNGQTRTATTDVSILVPSTTYSYDGLSARNYKVATGYLTSADTTPTVATCAVKADDDSTSIVCGGTVRFKATISTAPSPNKQIEIRGLNNCELEASFSQEICNRQLPSFPSYPKVTKMTITDKSNVEEYYFLPAIGGGTGTTGYSGTTTLWLKLNENATSCSVTINFEINRYDTAITQYVDPTTVPDSKTKASTTISIST